MFALEKVEVKCTSASTNSENQGQSEDTRLGLSLYVEYQGSNEFLDMFDAKLRPALYERAANDSQEDLTGHLPTPKFKLEKPIAWPLVCLGYTAIIHPEFSVNDEIEIEDCKVDKFHFTMQNDGVVGFKFRIYLHPDLDIVGPLAALEKHELQLSLIPPKVVPSAESETVDEESPQRDMLDEEDDSDPMQREVDVLYPRAVAAVRATGNPSATALQLELKTDFNHAALLLSRMFDEGVIENDPETGEYVVCEEQAEEDAA